jgi:hypothetical protein
MLLGSAIEMSAGANSGHAELVGLTAHSPCPRRQMITAVAV